MQIGYVRVSTNDQNTDLQRQALERAGCEHIFEEKMSGTVANRPALKKLLKALNEGDTLVVWKLDRLGRSMRNLVLLVDELRQRGIHFKSLTDSIDTIKSDGAFHFSYYVSSSRNGEGVDSGTHSGGFGGCEGKGADRRQASEVNC